MSSNVILLQNEFMFVCLFVCLFKSYVDYSKVGNSHVSENLIVFMMPQSCKCFEIIFYVA